MKFKIFDSIYTTTLIGIMGSLFLMAAVFTAFFLSQGIRIQEEGLLKRGNSLAANAAAMGELGVFSGNREMLQQLIENIMQGKDVTEVSFYDEKKQLLSGNRRNGTISQSIETDIVAWRGLDDKDAPNSYSFIAPVFSEQHSSALDLFSDAPGSANVVTIGWVRIELSGKGISEENRRLVIRSLAIALFIVLSASAMMYFFLSRQIGRPLRRLMGAVKEIGQGNLSQNINVNVSNEIGVLASEFNRMSLSLKEREEELLKLAKAVDGAEDVIAIADVDGYLVYVNPAFETLTGYGRDEALNTPLASYALSEEGQDEAAASIKTAIEMGVARNMVVKGRKKDGAPTLVAETISPIYSEKGERVYSLMIARDISERDRLEKSLMQSQKMEAIGTLAGGIAHDFNNLLAGIMGYNGLLQGRLAGEGGKVAEYLKAIENLTGRAASLTQQLLGFARRGKYKIEALNMNTLAEELIGFLGETFDRRITINRHLAPGLPDVLADGNQIHQVLLNICINARDAMPEGGALTLETCPIELDKASADRYGYDVRPGRYVEVIISDTGTGMDDATRKRIFEPFFTTKDLGKGTGLGLAMVFGIVKNHGGFINVYSEPGIGSSFKIYLPTSDREGNNDEKQGEGTMIRGNETILVIDDESFLRDVLGEMLTSAGYTVVSAENGEKGVALLAEDAQKFDMVILDLIMPGMSGKKSFEVIKGLRPDLKVLISSGYGQDGDVQEMLDNGASGFIQKPYLQNTILEKIHDVLTN